MAKALLQARGQSKWEYLPTDFDIPCFWTDEELARFEGSLRAEAFKQQSAAMLGEAERAGTPSTADSEGDSTEQYLWARAVVQTRSFTLGAERLLVPGLDLFNHETAGDRFPETEPRLRKH